MSRSFQQKENSQNEFLGKIDKAISQSRAKEAPKSLMEQVREANERNMRPKTFEELWGQFSKWETKVAELLCQRTQMPYADINDSLNATALAAKKWVTAEFFDKKVEPKHAAERIRQLLHW